MLTIYGSTLSPQKPFKKLLFLPTDVTDDVIMQTLEKYRMGKESSSNYVICKVNIYISYLLSFKLYQHHKLSLTYLQSYMTFKVMFNFGIETFEFRK